MTIYGTFIGSSNNWANAPGGPSWGKLSSRFKAWNNPNGETSGGLGTKWVVASQARGDRPFKDPRDRHQSPSVWMMDAISAHYNVSGRMLLIIDSATYSELWAGEGTIMFDRYRSIFEEASAPPSEFISISMAGSHTELVDHPFVFSSNIPLLIADAKRLGMLRNDALVLLETVPEPASFPDLADRLSFNNEELPKTKAAIPNSVIVDLRDLELQDSGNNIHYTGDSSRIKGRRLFMAYKKWKG